MLSGRQIHVHQALGLGPMWLSREARIEPIDPNLNAITDTDIVNATIQAPSPAVARDTAVVLPVTDDPKRTPSAQRVPKPAQAETVKHKVTQRAAHLLSIIAQAQHQPIKRPETKTPTVITPMTYQHDDLAHLATSVQACQFCDLSAERRQALSATQLADCRLIVVVPQPSLQDDENGSLLSGDVAPMWGKLINAIGLTAQQVYVTSAIKCAPNVSLVAKQHHAAQCSPYLQRELQLLPPVPVLLLAENQHSLWLRLQEWTDKQRVFRIPHPSKMLRNPAIKKTAWETLQTLQTHLPK